MNLKNIENALEIVKLLLLLDDKNSITSSEIRKNFKDTKPTTLDKRLNTLAKNGYVSKLYKKDIGKTIEPGSDKFEYQLTAKGLKIRTALIKKALILLDPVIKPIIQQKIQAFRAKEKVMDICEESLKLIKEYCSKSFNQSDRI